MNSAITHKRSTVQAMASSAPENLSSIFNTVTIQRKHLNHMLTLQTRLHIDKGHVPCKTPFRQVVILHFILVGQTRKDVRNTPC